MLDYISCLKQLYSLARFHKMKLGLESARKLSQAAGEPHKSYLSIHIAGTNGKGSTAVKISEALRKAGYKTGLYISPHLSSFRERIRVNGEFISENDMTRILSHLFMLAEQHESAATFFDITTLLAFEYFKEKKVDAAVIETGLGGRLDTTNILHPILSIITSISLDHTAILGNSIEQIAAEKAGIVKTKVPVVLGPNPSLKPIWAAAFEKNSAIFFAPPCGNSFEEENCSTAGSALSLLKSQFAKLTDEAIAEGLNASLPCRFEIISTEEGKNIGFSHFPEAVILDVAHNPSGLEALFSRARQRYPFKPIYALVNISKDKDLETCLKIIGANVQGVHVPEVINPRLTPREILITYFKKIYIHGFFDLLEQAYQMQGIVVACGTFYHMGPIRRLLGYNEPLDPLEINETLFH